LFVPRPRWCLYVYRDKEKVVELSLTLKVLSDGLNIGW
jgi:hypothetical protein